MISKFLALPLFIAAGVVAHPVRRDIPSLSQWASSGLESYWSYKVRYQSLSCSSQEGSDFYNTCCNPLPAGQTTANLPAECQPATLSCAASGPSPFTVTTSSAAPAPSDNGATTQSTNNGEEDCDDGSDDSDDYSNDSYTPPADNSGQTTDNSGSSGNTDNSGSYSDNSWNNNNNNNNNNGNSGTTTTTTNNNNSGNSGSTNNSGSSNNSGGGSGAVTGGYGTYFYQNGVAGACGTVHSDYDLIGAIDVAWYGDMGQQSQYCGRSVTVTNNNNGKSVTITVADVCPTCDNNNSFDLSVGAFQAIANLGDGLIPITWQFN